jgi:uncharacterized protein (TIRG00374 family)
VTGRARWVAAQAVITVILLGALLRGFDVTAFRELFARLPLWFYGLSLAVVLAGQMVYAWRWRLLLVSAGVHAPFPLVMRQHFIGIFVNNFLPSTVGGDVAKVYLLGRDYGYRPVTASVLLDRLLGIGLLALAGSITLWALPMPSPVVEVARLAVTAVAVAALVVLAVIAAGTGGLPARVSWLGAGAVSLAQRLQRLRVDMAAALTNPVVLAQSAAIVVGYALAVAGINVLFLTIQTGRAPSFAMMCGIAMAVAVLSNIPVSLNGLGLREQLHAVLLAPLGVVREMAVAISLIVFGHLMLASLLGLVFWLQAPGLPRALPRPGTGDVA